MKEITVKIPLEQPKEVNPEVKNLLYFFFTLDFFLVASTTKEY